jgi:hypothetical protein
MDKGKTFTKPVLVNDKKGDASVHDFFSPDIKIVHDGKINVLWTKTDFSPRSKAAGFGVFGLSSLRFASSVDGGKTFTRAVNVTDNNSPGASQIFGSFTVSPNGTIYVGWISQDSEASPSGSEVKISKSTDDGRTFGPSIKVDRPANQCDNINLVSDSNNLPYITWRKIFNAPKGVDPDSLVTVRDIVLSKSNTAGHSFTPPLKVHNDNFVTGQCITTGAPMAFDNKGRLHIEWYTGKEHSPGIYYAVSTDNGTTFSPPIAIINGSSVPPLKSSLTVDKSGNTWIAWEDTSGNSKQQFLKVPQSQLHNQAANSVFEDHQNQKQNQNQHHRQGIAMSSVHDLQNAENRMIPSKVRLSLVTPLGELVQSQNMTIPAGNIQSLAIASAPEGDLVSIVWTSDNSIYFLPIHI